jgi:hypothetical protein
MEMVGFLSEVNMSGIFIEPIKRVLKRKEKEPTMLEEQIRDTLPYYETEKAEEDEKL